MDTLKIKDLFLMALSLMILSAGQSVPAVAGPPDKIQFGHVAPPFHGQSKGVDDPEVRKKIFSYFPENGLVAIGWTENDFGDFTYSKRPVGRP